MSDQSKITVMMVDDDADDRFLFDEALTIVDPEINLITASDGNQAIQLLSSESLFSDIIFLDISMPVIDGWDCLIYIKSKVQLKHIPIIMYSTSESKRDIDKAYELGALCYCTKPDTFKDLVEMLKLIVENIGPGLLQALSECKECKTVYIQGGRNYKMLNE